MALTWVLAAVGIIVLSGVAVLVLRGRHQNEQLEKLLLAADDKLERLQRQFERFVPADVVERLTRAGDAFAPQCHMLLGSAPHQPADVVSARHQFRRQAPAHEAAGPGNEDARHSEVYTQTRAIWMSAGFPKVQSGVIRRDARHGDQRSKIGQARRNYSEPAADLQVSNRGARSNH